MGASTCTEGTEDSSATVGAEESADTGAVGRSELSMDDKPSVEALMSDEIEAGRLETGFTGPRAIVRG